MASITVNTNGQTLTVNASVSHWTTAALAVAASAANDVESTTTTTITSAYAMHFSDTATTALITVKQADGTTLLAQTFNVEAGTGARVLNPLPNEYQVAADLSATPHVGALAVGTSTLDRRNIDTASVTTSTGSMRISRFIPERTELCTKVRFLTGGTAAAAGSTVQRVGIYTVDSAGAATLAASTPHDAALGASTNTAYEKALSVSYTVEEGASYYWAYLIVTAGQAPLLCGTLLCGGNVTTESAVAPRLNGTLASQTDLPASFADASLSNSTSVIYGVVSP